MGYVVVTGSQAGPGLAIRKQLEASGRIVLGIDLPGKGAEVEAVLSTPDGRQEAIQNLLKQCGGVLDGLVCNVGVDHAPDSLVISLNYFGTVDLLVGLRDALAWGKQPAAVTNVSNSMLITPGIPEDVVECFSRAMREEPWNSSRIIRAKPMRPAIWPWPAGFAATHLRRSGRVVGLR